MIRFLEEKDIERVMDIWFETSITAHNFIDKNYWIKMYDVVRYDYLPIGETYVYEEDNVIKGFISIANKEFLGAIFIDDKYRGNGIGTKLLNFAKDKYKRLVLEVYKKNIQSIEFYEKSGFMVIDNDIDTDTGEKEYIMTWS